MISGELLIKLFGACKDGKCLTQLHTLTLKTGLAQDTFLAGKLINYYSKFSHLRPARKLFDETPQRPLHIWNCILKLYCRERHYEESLSLFSHLYSVEKPDSFTICIALKACAELKALEFGNVVHGFVKKSEKIGINLFIASALVELYSRCGKMDDALRVFEECSEPDAVLWTAIVTGYEKNGYPSRALEFLSRMVATSGIEPDHVTLVSAVSAYAQMLNFRGGMCIHGYTIKRGFNRNLSLLNALLSLYGKIGLMDETGRFFIKMEEKDVISWGSMIACYAHHGNAGEALDLFNEMVASGIEPNEIVLISALQACESTHNTESGKKIHELARRYKLDSCILVSTALIGMYMNCASPGEAINVFERMPAKDYVCYSSLLHGCVQNGMVYEPIEIFSNMLANGIHPHAIDFVKVMTACSELGFLHQTSCIHGLATREGVDKNCFVSASLIESYAKCGSLQSAVEIFMETEERDIVVWSSMCAGYGFHGKGLEAIDLFNQMIMQSAVSPNDVLFVSLLSSCSHAGLFKEGIRIFNMMVNDYQLTPNSKHYGIMVDLLGRIGELDEAVKIIGQIQEPVSRDVWGTLLGASRIYQNMEVAEIASRKLLELGLGDAGQLVLLSNMYTVDKKWDNAAEIRKFVQEKQLKKVSGQSVIELRNEVCSFVANDRSHRDFKLIYELLTELEGNMKAEKSNFCGNSILVHYADEIP